MRFQDDKLRELTAEQAAEWHVACSEGALDPQQAREFMRWLRASPTHVAEYLAIASIDSDIADAVRGSTVSWQDLLAGDDDSVRPLSPLQGAHFAEQPSHRAHARRRPTALSRRMWKRPLIRWIAAFAVLLMTCVGLLAAWHGFVPGPAIETFATLHGQERSLRLPDGTLAQLDSDSAITLRFDGNRRQIVMDRGQAWFKVAKDSRRPFSVRVGQSVIRDIGTTFDVYRHAAGTTITVTEGRVEVRTLPRVRGGTARWMSWFGGDEPRGTLLADVGAGEQVRMTAQGTVASLGRVDVEHALAWRQGRIAFDNQAIGQVAAEFNRYNDVQIEVDNADIAALPISGVFDAHGVPTFVAFLRGLPGISVEQSERRVYVRRKRQ